MGDFDTTPFCACGHSLYDHAIPAWKPAGECFVGGCGCGVFHVDELRGDGEPATPRGAA